MASSLSLELLRQRDPGAQQALRARFFAKVLATCRQVMNDQTRAEEIAEDVWMDFIYEHIDKLKKEQAIGAYLRMMTIRRCVRIKGWQNRHLEVEDNTPVLRSCDAESAMVSRIDDQDQINRLGDCLKKLTDRARVVLRLRFFHEMTQESIGQSLGVSKQYTGRVIKQSLNALRTCLEKA